MGFQTTYNTVALADIEKLAQEKKADGWRYVQTLAVNTEQGIDVLYSFMKGDVLDNVTIKGVGKEDCIPSITGTYLAAFVFENEIHDLFGVNVSNIAIDFKGNFYRLSQKEPMSIVSPEKLAAREKAAKIAAAKAAKEKTAKEKSASTDAADAELEAKLAAMDPEKAAKVRAAMEAKAKKEAKEKAQAADAELEAKLAAMDPEKAAKVRAAMEAKAKKAAREAAERKGE